MGSIICYRVVIFWVDEKDKKDILDREKKSKILKVFVFIV